jgi:single-strand DNA-binding protein
MRTMNKVVLIGRLGRDPELRTSQGGVHWSTLSIATSRPRKEGNNWVEETDWHVVKVFGKEAENLIKVLRRGALVAVEGSISYEKWTTAEGVKQTSTRIMADRVSLLASAPEREAASPAEAPADTSESAVMDAPF